MTKYYVEKENNIIKNPAYTNGADIEITEPFLEVTEEFYIQYKDLLPATYELDAEGNMINITPLPRPEPEAVIAEPTTEEILLLALTEIQQLKQKVAELEGDK